MALSTANVGWMAMVVTTVGEGKACLRSDEGIVIQTAQPQSLTTQK